MTIAQDLARFVTRLDMQTIPPEIIERARSCIVNGFGIALGGLATPYYRVAATAALETDGMAPCGATLLGDGRRSTVGAAVLANCALFHGRAQEDTCGTVHVGPIVIPLLTALVEAQGLPLERYIPALIAAYEVAGLFDGPWGVKTAPRGLRASPLYGTLGAAAATARLMDFDEAQTAAALANAASFTGGILQSFSDGTDEWRYQVGIAARNGLTAALLARAGSVSAPHAFEGKAGFIASYVQEGCDPAHFISTLGRDWALDRVLFKPYPVCAFNQTPVAAALHMRASLAGRAPSRVRVRMNPFETTYAGMLETGPFQTISGTLMSIPFCVAVTLLHGAPTMARMTGFDDAAVAALIAHTEVITDPSVTNLTSTLEVDLPDGSTLSHTERPHDNPSASRDKASALVRRIGAEENIDARHYDTLDAFADQLPGGSIRRVVDIFPRPHVSTFAARSA